ncbi:MAG: YaeQ family protein [Plesiomonas sp.]|uniref:YaeQ family protein n=1 Tax=Plesiomonas sp. TaxID=2486279 RepID=UPI003F3E6492
MALKATVYKANINIADMDRHHYQDVDLVIAQHPSETELRMMVRLLAWIYHADERLSFTKGLCAEDEPEIWIKNYHGGIDLWIDVGLPDEKRVKKAVNQSEKVVLYTYSERSARIWWEQNKNKLSQYKNLSIYFVPDEQTTILSQFVQRTMHIQATIEDSIVWFSDTTKNSQVACEKWQ